MLHAWRIAIGVTVVCGAIVPALTGTVGECDAATAGERPATLSWPRPEVLDAAVRAYECGRAAGYFAAPILTIIDYTLPSTSRRLWVVDLAKRAVLFHELVAHGRNSGEDRAVVFSDEPGSRMSSIGVFRTGEAYVGKHGWALRLDGLEPGFNERARVREIVLHGAPYVSPHAIADLHRLGRSWGCPVVRLPAVRHIIGRIEGGTALVAYYPDAKWLRESSFLRCPDAGLARDPAG